MIDAANSNSKRYRQSRRSVSGPAWLLPDQITGARIRKGLIWSRLFIELEDGDGIKVLWVRRSSLHPSIDAVEGTLRRWEQSQSAPSGGAAATT